MTDVKKEEKKIAIYAPHLKFPTPNSSHTSQYYKCVVLFFSDLHISFNARIYSYKVFNGSMIKYTLKEPKVTMYWFIYDYIKSEILVKELILEDGNIYNYKHLKHKIPMECLCRFHNRL